jgi:hypothetical protein
MSAFAPLLLIAASLPILSRQAESEGDRRLFWLLVAALVVKMIGAILRYEVAVDLYGGRADALAYHGVGAGLAQDIRGGALHLSGSWYTGTRFIELLTGLVYTLIGPSKIGGFFFFSWLGFWGLFCFYRAFRIAVPEGRSRSYARLVFFLPSLVFWPSSTGKEAWMVFALGIGALGVAHALSGKLFRGLSIAALGLGFAAIVRPHVAGLLGVAFAVAFVLRRAREGRRINPIFRVVSLAALALAAVFLIGYAGRFLQGQGFDTQSGISGLLEQVAETTGQGGAEYTPPIINSPAKVPIAAATVLYRPFPTEAHNLTSLAGAMEGAFLIVLTLIRLRSVLEAVRGIFRRSYVAMCLAYTTGFIFAFSSIGNFGILARERVQLLPLYLVLLCVLPKKVAVRRAAGHARIAIT